ncbi:hypothetical protein [Caulifigura coniformis]|uniref:hypothetical protein n=1 Tax=Caulifigura coniformis TaxID=2527983 RepID=UPI00119E3E30|nr:hypothetical protein [Caulifigura coniformis]
MKRTREDAFPSLSIGSLSIPRLVIDGDGPNSRPLILGISKDSDDELRFAIIDGGVTISVLETSGDTFFRRNDWQKGSENQLLAPSLRSVRPPATAHPAAAGLMER